MSRHSRSNCFFDLKLFWYLNFLWFLLFILWLFLFVHILFLIYIIIFNFLQFINIFIKIKESSILFSRELISMISHRNLLLFNSLQPKLFLSQLGNHLWNVCFWVLCLLNIIETVKRFIRIEETALVFALFQALMEVSKVCC